MQEPYDYFSDMNVPLVTADYNVGNKKAATTDYLIADRAVQSIPRDRLLNRQNLANTQRLDNPNKPITVNNGEQTQIIIGFSENGF